MSWVVPSRQVPSRQFRVPFTVSEAITGAHGAGLSVRGWQVGSVALFPAGSLGFGFASRSAGRSDLGLLVSSRPVRSGVALCQAGLVGRPVATQYRRRVELAVGGGAVITRESVVGRCGCQVPRVP